jgi:hypothetical protein
MPSAPADRPFQVAALTCALTSAAGVIWLFADAGLSEITRVTILGIAFGL